MERVQVAERNWRVAVVGAGPAGLYATDALLKRGAQVDVFESQFAPFGLVRYGVAPDHQKIKKTQIVFQRILDKPNVRLFANVRIGVDLSIDQLKQEYDQILITMGSSGARSLGIPGEELAGSVSATELVNWYNGHPDFLSHAPSLHHRRAIVIGMGNVAIDVARILIRAPEELAPTDISEPALEVLRNSSVEEVVLFARRGPNQAAFDNKEVRELATLEGVSLGVDGYVSKRPTEKSEFISAFPRANTLPDGKKVILHFCASPVGFEGGERVTQVRVERNDLRESAGGRMRAVGTGEFSHLDAGLVVRAIGYDGTVMPGVPFHDDSGTIPNDEGRVLEHPEGPVIPNLYVAGWIKRGPTGLIGTNKGCAVGTVDKMEADLDQVGPERDPARIPSLLGERNVRYLSQEDWKLLDAHEKAVGEASGRVRTKLLSLNEALRVLDGSEEDPRALASGVRATKDSKANAQVS